MIIKVLLNAIVSGLTALDTMHIAQWMISRPIVAGTISGFVMADPVSGILAGACIELIWLGVLPIGNYTPPDSHVAAVGAATLASIWNSGWNGRPEGFVLIAVLIVVPVGILSKHADLQIRRSLAIRVEQLLASAPPYDIRAVGFISVVAVSAKAAVIVLLLGVFAMATEPIALKFAADKSVQKGLLAAFALVPALGMVQLAMCLGARGRERYVGAGAAAALIAYLVLEAVS